MSRTLSRIVLPLLVLAALAFALLWWMERAVDRVAGAAPETIVAASIEGLREQNRLSAFVASYVAVVTSTQSRLGLKAAKTLIMPGTVRYEVDLGKLADRDVVWNAEARMLDVTLPPVEVVGPQVDLTRMKEYDSGGILMALSDAESRLDAANRRAGQAELLRQAREPVPMNLAKDATRRAVERSFALPLRAAGLEAVVRVRFPDEPGFRTPVREEMDRSTALEDVVGTPERTVR